MSDLVPLLEEGVLASELLPLLLALAADTQDSVRVITVKDCVSLVFL